MQKHIYWVFFVFISTFSAQAANWKDNPEFTSGHPCAKDLPKFCAKADLVPSKQNHYRCLGQNYSRLSQSCHQFMTTFWKPFACAADILKLCKGEDQNIGRSMPCLEGQKQKLSPNCKAYVNRMEVVSQARVEQHAACDKEREKFCAKERGADLGNCMKKNEDKLSSDCKAKTKKLLELL